MEFLEPVMRARSKRAFFHGILLWAVLIDCSEFNEPVTPVVPFTREAGDEIVGLHVSFGYYAGSVTLRVNRDTQKPRWPKASLFIKIRNENEFITGDLSGIPVDFRMDIAIDTTSFTNETSGISYTIFDSRGDSLYSGSTADAHVLLLPEELLPRGVSLFFWQFEFYGKLYTLHLPQNPGIWYFGFTD